jgi:hypothetical protein
MAYLKQPSAASFDEVDTNYGNLVVDLSSNPYRPSFWRKCQH